MILELKDIRIPTTEQCSSHDIVYETESKVGVACWYPQMGGYVARAVVIIDKEWKAFSGGSQEGGCFDMLIWHDGEFPFDEESGQSPAHLHHCDPQQFINFGNFVKELNDKGRQNS